MRKLVALLAVFLLVGCASIKNEYEGISGKTAVKQISEDEVMEVFQNGTGVVLFSFPESEWCQELMPLLNEEALKVETEVMYYNVRDIRESKTDEYTILYNEIVRFLETTEFDELRYEEIFVPTMVKLENGNIIDFHLGTVESHVETSNGLPNLTISQKSELKSVITRILE